MIFIHYPVYSTKLNQPASALMKAVVNSTSSVPPANAHAITASTISANGTYLWLFDGQQSDMSLTWILLRPSNTSTGYASYIANQFNLTQLASWSTNFPTMGCQFGVKWYLITYLQTSSPIMSYTSYIIDLSDDR